jgi:hypothetical protein
MVVGGFGVGCAWGHGRPILLEHEWLLLEILGKMFGRLEAWQGVLFETKSDESADWYDLETHS